MFVFGGQPQRNYVLTREEVSAKIGSISNLIVSMYSKHFKDFKAS